MRLPRKVEDAFQGGSSHEYKTNKHSTGVEHFSTESRKTSSENAPKQPLRQQPKQIKLFRKFYNLIAWEDLEEDAVPAKLERRINGRPSRPANKLVPRTHQNGGIKSQQKVNPPSGPRVHIDEPYIHDNIAEIERTLARGRNSAVPNLLIEQEEIVNTLSEYSKRIDVGPTEGRFETARPGNAIETKNTNQENLTRGKKIYEEAEQQQKRGDQANLEKRPPREHHKDRSSNFEREIQHTTSLSRKSIPSSSKPCYSSPPAIRAGAGDLTPRPRKIIKDLQSPGSKIALGISALRNAELDPSPTPQIPVKSHNRTFAQEAEKVRQWELQQEKAKEAKDFEEVKRKYGNDLGGRDHPSAAETTMGPIVPPKISFSNSTQTQGGPGQEQWKEERDKQRPGPPVNQAKKKRDFANEDPLGLKNHPPFTHPLLQSSPPVKVNPSSSSAPRTRFPEAKPQNLKRQKSGKLSKKMGKGRKKKVERQEALMSGANDDIHLRRGWRASVPAPTDSEGSVITYNEGRKAGRSGPRS